MHVSELMTAPVYTCRPSDSLTTAAHIMWENDFGIVAVLDDSNRVVAAVTDRDVCMAAYTQGRGLRELSVRDCMSPEVVTCRASDALETALETMARARVRRLPVVDDQGRLEGMLSMADVVCCLAQDGSATPEVTSQLLRALAAVSSPRGRESTLELEPQPPQAIQPAKPTKVAKAAKAAQPSQSAQPAKKPADKKTTTRKKGGR